MSATTETTFVDSTCPAPSGPGPGPLAAVDRLLRDRQGLLERIEAGRDLPGLARAMIATIVVSAFIFGAAVGLYRGGIQVFFAAVKLPLVILLTAAICTPALSALRRVASGRAAIHQDIALVLSSLALGSLLLAALAPILLLATSWGLGYHDVVLVVVGCCAAAGIGGVSFFVKGMKRGNRGARFVVGPALLLVLALVGTQMTWTFRPYLVRPRTEEVPFIRAVEGSFLDSVAVSVDSARGVYHRSAAPLPGDEVIP